MDISQRKQEHLDFVSSSQQTFKVPDPRFFYEPLLATHPNKSDNLATCFLGKILKVPMWISSMTGGTPEAKKINESLARACGEFGLGMGLGSCRILLEDEKFYSHFAWRRLVGNFPFYANLGIAQVEKLLQQKQENKITHLVEKLEADGLIIHVNPLQEWLQPQGDRFQITPFQVLENLLEKCSFPIIVKEVGQGMGPMSIKALLKLPLAAIELSAFGGTNFSQVEMARNSDQDLSADWVAIGHGVQEMVQFVLAGVKDARCHEVIISGGIRSFLDGHYFMEKLASQGLQGIYGQGYPFLQKARNSYESLAQYIQLHADGLKMARKFLRVKELS